MITPGKAGAPRLPGDETLHCQAQRVFDMGGESFQMAAIGGSRRMGEAEQAATIQVSEPRPVVAWVGLLVRGLNSFAP